MTLQAEIDSKRREIQTEGYPMSVGELLNLYRDDELDIHPEFQRFFRWTPFQKSRFIESLLLGIPIPSVFVHQRRDGIWDVIDGLQRLSTIFEFVGVLRDEDDGEIYPSVLEATEYLPSLDGKTWNGGGDAAITPDQQRLIKRAAIDRKIVKRESDEETKYDLFQRLNTGGSQLSDQEVRNCLLIMTKRDFYFWLRDLQEQRAFQDSIAVSDKSLEEQYDLELVLRFLAIKDAEEDSIKAIRDMSDFLTAASVRFAADDDYNRAKHANDFSTTFSLIFDALGADAFRRYDVGEDRFLGGFSVSAFEAMTIGVYANADGWLALETDDRTAGLTDKAKELWQDEVFKSRSGSGIRASGRIPHTVPRGRDLFAP